MIGSIVRSQPNEPGQARGQRLVIELTGGPEVGAGLTRVVSKTRPIIKAIGRVLEPGRSSPEKTDHPDCELYVVGWRARAARAVLELPPGGDQLSLFETLGQESLACFLDGLKALSQGGLEPGGWPPGFDQEVLQGCGELAELLTEELLRVRFSTAGREAVLDHRIRDLLRFNLARPADPDHLCVVGRLVSLDDWEGLSGTLWDAAGTRWICRFKEAHYPHLGPAFRQTIELTGRARVEPGREHILEVDSLAVPLEPETGTPAEDRLPAEFLSMADMEAYLPPHDEPEEMLANLFAE